MSTRTTYPSGVPCWVSVLAADPRAACGFYGPLFGWEFAGPGGPDDEPFYEATLHGARVVGTLPGGAQPGWMTNVCVDEVDNTARQAVQAGGTLVAGPMNLPPAGRLAVLADPSGAVLCAMEPDERQGAERVNEPGAWAMSALITPDPDAAKAFYSNTFGWQAESAGPTTMWRLPGYVGGEPQQPVPRDVVATMETAAEGTAAHWAVDFWIADADAAARAARQHGGRVLVQPHNTDIGFRTALLADPEGATFSVSQLLMTPAAP